MASRTWVYLIFVLSGSTALTYQIIWARWLALVFGSTTPSVSIVLSGFMSGLALGSWLVGRWLPRVGAPLRLFACLELGIGAFALAFPILTAGADAIFAALVGEDASVLWGLCVRATLAALVLIVPTTLMGATLPLLSEFFHRGNERGAMWKVGLLYGGNTLGAALGTLLVSFVSIELIGVRNTTLLAACLNLIVGVSALRIQSDVAPARKPSPLPAAGPGLTRLALGVLAASGATALASEVLWTRTVEGLVGNSTYAFAMLLMVYLVGIALGSAGVSCFVKRLEKLPLWLVASQLASAGWMLAAISLFYGLADALRPLGGQALPPTLLLLFYVAASVILFPLGLLSGAVFPLATRILDAESVDAAGERVARAYTWNTVGAVVGGLLGGFVIAPHLDLFQGIYALVALYAATAFVGAALLAAACTASTRRDGSLALAGVALTLAVVAVVRLGDEKQFQQRLEASRPGAELVFHATGIQGITTVLTLAGDPGPARALLVNHTGMTARVTDTKMMAHVPLLLHPDPEDTLVICFGMGTTYRSAVSHGRSVTVVELVDEVFEAFPFFHLDAEQVRAYPRGRMVTNDGRSFLKLSSARYDVITVDPPPPIDGAGVNHLYSLDFLELARDRLKPGGLMTHWIPLPGSLAGVDDWETFGMLLRTFAEAFPHTLEIPSGNRIGVHVVGSMQPIEVSDERIRARLADPNVARDASEWGSVTSDYFGSTIPIDRDAVQHLPLVTDDRPNLEFGWIRAWRGGMPRLMRRIYW